STAHKSVGRPETHCRVIQQQIIFCPYMSPGKDHQSDTQFQANKNKNQQAQAAGPHVATGGLGAALGSRFLFRRQRAAGQAASWLAGLIGQASPALPGYIRIRIHAALSSGGMWHGKKIPTSAHALDYFIDFTTLRL